MMRRFLLWLTARLPAKAIAHAGVPYVEWYYLGTFLGLFRVQIHRFIGPDPEGYHDHPWPWALSIILSGWYVEQRRDAIRIRSRGYLMPSGDVFHRVVIPHGSEVWTLFVHGPYVKHWGFMRPHTTEAGTPDWCDLKGGWWIYEARDRDHSRWSNWHKTAPKGRALRALEPLRRAA